MGLTPSVLNILALTSLLHNYKGTIRNLIFIVLFWIANFYLGAYLFGQADRFYNSSEVTDTNRTFAYFLAAVLLFDFLACFVKFRTIKYHVYNNRDVFEKRMGCLSILESLLIGLSIIFNLVPAIWLMKIIANAAPAGDLIYPFTVFLVLIKWGIVCYKCLFITPSTPDGWDEKIIKPPAILDHLADIILTVSSAILFTVIWQLAIKKYLEWYHPFEFHFAIYTTIIIACGRLILLVLLSIALYMPTRLIFIMEDYYALTNIKHRRAAFYSSVLAIAVSVAVGIFNSV